MADTGETALTFLPGNFAGAATGMYVRNGIALCRRNPQACGPPSDYGPAAMPASSTWPPSHAATRSTSPTAPPGRAGTG